jgi:HSP20 family protein
MPSTDIGRYGVSGDRSRYSAAPGLASPSVPPSLNLVIHRSFHQASPKDGVLPPLVNSAGYYVDFINSRGFWYLLDTLCNLIRRDKVGVWNDRGGTRTNPVCLNPSQEWYKIIYVYRLPSLSSLLYLISNLPSTSVKRISIVNMPSLYSLNSPPHPFWDFVASLDEGASSSQPSNFGEDQQKPARAAGESYQKNTSEKQPTVEDEGAAESSSQERGKAREAATQASSPDQQMPFHGRGRRDGDGAAHRGHRGERRGACHGRRGGRGGFGEAHQHHPPGEGFDGFGDFNPFGMRGPPFGGFGFFGPPHRGPPAPPGPPGAHHEPHPHHDRPHRPHSSPHHSNCGSGIRGGSNNFNIGEFLSNLGSRLGLDLAGAAQGLGVDRFAGGKISLPEGVDFEPRADIFDTAITYLIHLSLPGAKKEDIGVDWDGENSTLRIGGVVHRPGVDEETLKLLAVDGRKKETGVFEKKIHLGTKRDPAKIDVGAITAKMTDGVLVVKVPKLEFEQKKREVPISGSAPPSPVRAEKQQQGQQQPAPAVTSHVDNSPNPEAITEKGKKVAAEMDVDDVRSETERGDEMEYDDPAEQLPEYKESRDEGAEESEEEGDFIKVDVQ